MTPIYQQRVLRKLLPDCPSSRLLENEASNLCSAVSRMDSSLPGFVAAKYEPEVIRQAAKTWTMRRLREYESTHIFASIASQLMEANVPEECTLLALRCAQDEVRHAWICDEVLLSLGVTLTDHPPRVSPLARHLGCTPLERVLRNVLYACCLSETVAVAQLVDEFEQTQDDMLRAATRFLLADERMHSQFGFALLDVIEPVLTSDLKRSLSGYLVHAFAVFERAALGGSIEQVRLLSQEDGQSAFEPCLGFRSSNRTLHVFHSTVEQAIVPALEMRGLQAREAYLQRSIIEVS